MYISIRKSIGPLVIFKVNNAAGTVYAQAYFCWLIIEALTQTLDDQRGLLQSALPALQEFDWVVSR